MTVLLEQTQVLPMYMGMILTCSGIFISTLSTPHVYGDDSGIKSHLWVTNKYSPYTWG